MLHPLVQRSIGDLGVAHEVMACEPEFADTAAFCAHYGIDPAESANTILVISKRPPGRLAACVVLATTRLDVNRAVCGELGVKKASFAGAEQTVEATGMEIGGVTPFGLPPSIPVLIDGAVMSCPSVVLGGGNRSSKLRMPPDGLTRLPAAQVVEGLARPFEAS